MITCTLGEKKYSVDFVSGRVLREIDPAARMYAKIVEGARKVTAGEDAPELEQVAIADAMDIMVQWFCILFRNQFTPEEVYENYPCDSLMHDIAFAIMAVQQQTTSVLSEFPIPAAQTEKTTT